MSGPGKSDAVALQFAHLSSIVFVLGRELEEAGTIAGFMNCNVAVAAFFNPLPQRRFVRLCRRFGPERRENWGLPRQELTMKHFVFAAGVLAFALAVSSPARADYAVVQLQDGWCKIWWDSSATPWGVGWRKIAIGLPDWLSAHAALDTARSQGVCR